MKFKKVFEQDHKGLVCDNPNCNWIDFSIQTKDYKKHLNRPCPNCGHNILTLKDFILFKILVGMMNIVNIIGYIYQLFGGRFSNKRVKFTYDFTKHEFEIGDEVKKDES